eukprot:SAG22_NODE_2635_length_2348_cov_16.497554_2_plen_91_part_00
MPPRSGRWPLLAVALACALACVAADKFTVQFDVSVPSGDESFQVEVDTEWAPIGAVRDPPANPRPPVLRNVVSTAASRCVLCVEQALSKR